MSNISLKRLQKEYENFKKDPSEDFVAFPIKVYNVSNNV